MYNFEKIVKLLINTTKNVKKSFKRTLYLNNSYLITAKARYLPRVIPTKKALYIKHKKPDLLSNIRLSSQEIDVKIPITSVDINATDKFGEYKTSDIPVARIPRKQHNSEVNTDVNENLSGSDVEFGEYETSDIPAARIPRVQYNSRIDPDVNKNLSGSDVEFGEYDRVSPLITAYSCETQNAGSGDSQLVKADICISDVCLIMRYCNKGL